MKSDRMTLADMIRNSKKVKVHVGMVFLNKGIMEAYIIAQVATNTIAAINLESGNRWVDGIKLSKNESIHNISNRTLEKVFGDPSLKGWIKISEELPWPWSTLTRLTYSLRRRKWLVLERYRCRENSYFERL